MTREASLRRFTLDYARRSGLLASEHPPLRYLWTDAFAVCNFLGLYEMSGDREALGLALRLVDQTHHVLGQHRSDDPRVGWISGLSEREGELHPTAGGLRIGKPLPERDAREPVDRTTEWNRDGQYFHYLTRWMHALARVAGVTGDPVYHRQACELAKAAYAGFTRASSSGRAHLHWKMSIDLTRPQVISPGHHDPLDGLVVYSRLHACNADDSALDLSSEIRGLREMCAGRSWDTDDALGIGGLLCDAYWLAQPVPECIPTTERLLEDLLWSARLGLEALLSRDVFHEIAERRLAFRELGLAIGLRAVARISDPGRHASGLVGHSRVGSLLADLALYRGLPGHVERFWLDPTHRETRNWADHRDINEVMLATSLGPDGYLGPVSKAQCDAPAVLSL